MMDEHVLGLAELADHADVELPLHRVLAALQDGPIVAPVDFSHQWREFFKTSLCFEKGLHSPEVGNREPAHAGEVRRKRRRAVPPPPFPSLPHPAAPRSSAMSQNRPTSSLLTALRSAYWAERMRSLISLSKPG